MSSPSQGANSTIPAYNPSIGTFISPDTIVPEAGNVFAYDRYMYVYGRVMGANVRVGMLQVARQSLLAMATAFVGGGEVLPEEVSPGDAVPIYMGGKTQGVLDTGSELIPIKSGYDGASSRAPETPPE